MRAALAPASQFRGLSAAGSDMSASTACPTYIRAMVFSPMPHASHDMIRRNQTLVDSNRICRIYIEGVKDHRLQRPCRAPIGLQNIKADLTRLHQSQ